MRKGTKRETMRKTGAGTVLETAGICLLVCILLLCVPLTVPRAMGLQIYAAIDFNYGPEVAEGSLIYVEQAVEGDLAVGDMVTYYSADGGGVALRLVGENDEQAQSMYVTDGWGNGETVSCARVMGRVVAIIPALGPLMSAISTVGGALCIGGIFLLGLLLIALGERKKETVSSPDGGKTEWS